jgi:hypothetical protein
MHTKITYIFLAFVIYGLMTPKLNKRFMILLLKNISQTASHTT